jgi:hypothetical protein
MRDDRRRSEEHDLKHFIHDEMAALAEHLDQHLDRHFRRVEEQLTFIKQKEIQQMALGQDILDKITAQTTLIAGIRTLIQGLVASGTITPEVAAAITAKLGENSSQLEAALADGVVVPPTP